jgi:hypothetical protein
MLVEEIGVDASLDHGRGHERVLALVLLGLATEVVLGQMTIAHALVLNGLGRRRSGLLDSFSGQLEQDLSWERVVASMRGGQLRHDRVGMLACHKAQQSEAGRAVVVPVGRASLAGHSPNAIYA